MSRHLSLARFPGEIALCTSEAQFNAFLKRHGIAQCRSNHWIGNAFGRLHTFDDDGLNCAVCLDPDAHLTGMSAAATLCHESVHIFQNFAEFIGEKSPSKEFEAYSIERIFTELMGQYMAKVIVL